jgi:hypothetical protein
MFLFLIMLMLIGTLVARLIGRLKSMLRTMRRIDKGGGMEECMGERRVHGGRACMPHNSTKPHYHLSKKIFYNPIASSTLPSSLGGWMGPHHFLFPSV